MITESQIEAAAIAILTAQPGGYDWDIQTESVKDKYRRVARLALEAGERAAWRPIKEAPTLERVFVSGWQPKSESTDGYWWLAEDATDEKGIPFDRPAATHYRPLPQPPGGQR